MRANKTNTDGLELIATFPPKLKTPLTALYKRDAIDESVLSAVADAAALTKPDMQLFPFALGLMHMRHNAIPIIDTLRMAREQGRKINLHWSAKRWKLEHDRLSRFSTLKRLSGEGITYDLTAFDGLLPNTYAGYLIRSSSRLGAEGLRQRHCVASWHTRIMGGHVAIASIFINQKRFTVELLISGKTEKNLTIGQVRGRFNCLPTKEESDALYSMLDIDRHVNVDTASHNGSSCYTVNLSRLIPVLQQQSVSKVTVYFDGSGDSGCIDSVFFYGEQGQYIPAPKENITIIENYQHFDNGIWVRSSKENTKTISDAVEDIVDDWLDFTEVDWYNNDGGYGECVIDVLRGELSLDIEVRVSISENAYYQEYTVDELTEIGNVRHL